MNVKRYSKALVAIGAAVTIAVAAAADGVYTASEVVQTILAALGALGVYAVRNADS